MKSKRQLICLPFSLLLGALALSAIGQTYEPRILILLPSNVSAEKGLKVEIEEYNELLKKNEGQKEQSLKRTLKVDERMPDNFKIISQKQIDFNKNMDFYGTISYVAEGYLQYTFFERFENLLIYAVKEKSSGDIEKLANVAEKHDMQYVLNFPKVYSFIEGDHKLTTINVQLYDYDQNKLVLDSTFTGDDRNPGFEFTCTDSSLFCTINNALSEALREIIEIVASNNPTIIHEQEIAIERANVLLTEYYTKEPASEIIDIINESDSTIPTAGFYHGIMDESQTKFIGFFALDSKVENFEELVGENDENIRVVSEDTYDLDNVPRIYANIIVGVNYQSKWYFKRDKITYFNSSDLDTGKKEFFNNLQAWYFFKENSSEYNPDFWETYFFDKVKDVTAEPDYEEFYESIYKNIERENRDYISMYSIVVHQLKKEQAESISEFKKTISEEILRPFLEQQKSDDPLVFTDYSLMYDRFTLIFPKNRSIVLNPIQIKDNRGYRHVRYFVVFPETKEVYEWTYFKPIEMGVDSWHYGGEIIDQLSKITEWHFGFKTLDDRRFWGAYVLAKEGGKYKYLKIVE